MVQLVYDTTIKFTRLPNYLLVTMRHTQLFLSISLMLLLIHVGKSIKHQEGQLAPPQTELISSLISLVAKS